MKLLDAKYALTLVGLFSVLLSFSGCAVNISSQRFDDGQTKSKPLNCEINLLYTNDDLSSTANIIGEVHHSDEGSCPAVLEEFRRATCTMGGDGILFDPIYDTQKCSNLTGKVIKYIPATITRGFNTTRTVAPNESTSSSKMAISNTTQTSLKMAISSFYSNSVSSDHLKLIEDKLGLELMSSNNFDLLERSQMNLVLNEQGFQQSGCVEDECIVEIGKLTGVEVILAGKIGLIDDLYIITLRAIDVETGRVRFMVVDEFQGSLKSLFQQGIPKLAEKMNDSLNPQP